MKYFKTFEEFSDAGSVPGMGNPIAPGPDSIGSGDTWDSLGATGPKKKRKKLNEDNAQEEILAITEEVLEKYRKKYPRSQNHLERFENMILDLIHGNVDKLRRWDFGFPGRSSGQWGVDMVRDLEKAGVLVMFKISRTMYERAVTEKEWIDSRGSRVGKNLSIIERIELDDLKDTNENAPGYVFLSAESDHSLNLPYFEICRTYGKESFHYRINNRPGMLEVTRRQYGDSFPIALTERVNSDILERYINFYKELGININEHPNRVGKSEPHILFDFPIEPRMQKNWGDDIVKKLTVFSFRLLTDNVNLYFQSIKNSVYDWSNLNTDERIQKLMQKYNIKDAGSFDDKTITPLQKKLLHSHRGESVGHRAGILAEDANSNWEKVKVIRKKLDDMGPIINGYQFFFDAPSGSWGWYNDSKDHMFWATAYGNTDKELVIADPETEYVINLDDEVPNIEDVTVDQFIEYYLKTMNEIIKPGSQMARVGISRNLGII